MDYSAFSTAFPGKVFFPDSTEYEDSVASYFAAFEKELRPSCIVTPRSAQDVSNIIKAISGPAVKGYV